jgi:hypothetical protein
MVSKEGGPASIMKKRKPLEDVEFRDEAGGSSLQLQSYFQYKEQFNLDGVLKHLRNLKKPAGLFSGLFSPPALSVTAVCYCKFSLALGLSDGSVAQVDSYTGQLISQAMVLISSHKA